MSETDRDTTGDTGGDTAGDDTTATTATPPVTYGKWMGTMWLFTALRFGLFFALWGILLLVGLESLFAALVALVLSVPLSFVLLAKPRRAFTAQLQARIEAQQARRTSLDKQLDPEGHDTEH